MSASPRIELRKLTKVFHSGSADLSVLKEVDLEISAEESVAILGPSGSGKSTLLALVAGLDRPTSGEILIDGQLIQALSESELALLRRHKIGFVFQSFQLLPNMTALENVQLPLELLSDSRAQDRASELLDLVGLTDRAHHYPTQLSGGEQQRVALARAFAPSPAILLADEPTGNLDRRTGRTVLDLITSLRQRFGTTLVLVTHDSAAAQLADRRLALEDGRLVPATSETDGLLVPPG